ncbi:MAG: alpha/beta hydrolase [Alphaproteobacteria bacterium]|nr:alpha/beta hydrolase [Alphaproteobacteria bacterium]MBV9150394.1 alpha/beta hydrolase [Alphaproteobacteria bacterium]
MLTTVYFATNRAPQGPADDVSSYGTDIVSPSDPSQITYATAFVDNTNLTADTTGAIQNIENISKGRFSQSAMDDLSKPGRNVLVFIHGFDNSFENAVTRAAFNREWFAASGIAAADTTVVGFSWPSLGQLISFPLPWDDCQKDQVMAGQSGLHLMSFFANLQPLLQRARANGSRIFLLTHSMGNWALQGAVESWFSHGNGDAALFDEAILAAADERYDTFNFPEPGRLRDLYRLAGRTSIYFSGADQVLKVSELVNLGAERLGQDGPDNRHDTARFPQSLYRMVDCTGFTDYDVTFEYSHQYYRRSPGVRADIAQLMEGAIV